MERFLGTIDAKADAKGRVPIPIVFRRILLEADEKRLVLQKNIYKDCLVLYPKSKWNEEVENLRSQLNIRDEDEYNLFRTFTAYADEVEIDSNGRILIPRRYMEMAGLGAEMRFLGVDFTIEIWNRNKLEDTLLTQDKLKQMYKKLFGTKKDEN